MIDNPYIEMANQLGIKRYHYNCYHNEFGSDNEPCKTCIKDVFDRPYWTPHNKIIHEFNKFISKPKMKVSKFFLDDNLFEVE